MNIENQKEFIEKVKKLNSGKNMKYAIYTMGCQLNENDSEKLIGIMEKMGYTKSKDIKNADLYVINTCCVTFCGKICCEKTEAMCYMNRMRR